MIKTEASSVIQTQQQQQQQNLHIKQQNNIVQPTHPQQVYGKTNDCVVFLIEIFVLDEINATKFQPKSTTGKEITCYWWLYQW
jgi:prolipoprotein diacylglyceryltransferase